tara:strand:- start:305 stop:1363 length:1059 start_codon:yes stop_codon:yes gene_type:complete
MANVTYTVPNKNGSYDGDMVVKQYTSLTIDTNDIVTVDQPCRGLMILVQGNATINGELRMRGRGGNGDPTSSGGSDSNDVSTAGLRFPFLTSGGSSSLTAQSSLLDGCGTTARSVIANFKTLSSDGTILSLVRQGANGGTAVGNTNDGNAGYAGSTGQTGGGGGGCAVSNGTSGAGAYGSCFTGGSGGGSIDNGGTITSGTIWGGAGGNSATSHTATGSGGAGNPAGADFNTAGNGHEYGPEGGGTGGTIILIVGGNLTIGASGKINCDGGRSKHSYGSDAYITTGGAAGGGNIIIAHKGSYTNNGSVTANGGLAGRCYVGNYGYGGTESSGTQVGIGGNGGNGSVQTLAIL